ncbi:MAG: helix-turn-helix domain-containing protein [Woeseiaceae bacterium]|nr:helix-turn-helix domain-containing protein [Woeseiaceae bacterium]MDJ0939693.1 helix-turn-helix domain-containing protein [Woeseiaceae bacterium]
MTNWVSTKQATELLGVGPTTIKRWADEGRLAHYRTAGGHRRYRLSTIEALASGQDADRQAAAGHTAQRWYEYLRDASLDTVVSRMRRLPDQTGDWYAAAEVLGAAMDHLGRRYADEACSIAETNIVTWKLLQTASATAASLRAPAGAARCLVAAVPGDLHGVGAVLAQLCLRGAGYEAFVLGSGIPARQLKQHLAGSGLGLLALSAANWHTDPVTLKQYAGEISGACRKESIELVLGGQGAWQDKPGYGYRCRSFMDLRSVIDKISLK